MLDALSPRFPSTDNNAIPGPGAYGVPDAKIEEKKWSQGGKVQLFERSKQPRCLPDVVSILVFQLIIKIIITSIVKLTGL